MLGIAWLNKVYGSREKENGHQIYVVQDSGMSFVCPRTMKEQGSSLWAGNNGGVKVEPKQTLPNLNTMKSLSTLKSRKNTMKSHPLQPQIWKISTIYVTQNFSRVQILHWTTPHKFKISVTSNNNKHVPRLLAAKFGTCASFIEIRVLSRRENFT